MKNSVLLLMLIISIYSQAQPPDGYYSTTSGKVGEELMESLYLIIKDHSSLSYSNLWDAFYYTDKKDNGKVWDMYSDIPNGTPPYQYSFYSDQCGNYSGEGDCYNREHSVPASWYNDDSPMYTDLFHLYPTDGYVNNRRSNYPFGEVGTVSWSSDNGSKVGGSSYSGYGGEVFEPIDEYKGDFARSYFYMVTRYYNVAKNWNSDMLNGTQYPAFSEWAESMLLKWHELDPVSQKEIDRNNTIYSNYQGNRNPFIDHPEFALKIWDEYNQIQLKERNHSVIVYPNPASDIITVDLGDNQCTEILVLSITGTPLKTIISNSLQRIFEISVVDLPEGVYLIAAKCNDKNNILRLIVYR